MPKSAKSRRPPARPAPAPAAAPAPATVRLDTLTPHDRNPRTITDEAFATLCESIKRDPEFMALRPIVVDPSGVIWGGNKRYRACVALGMQEVPPAWVKVASNLTAEQKKRFVLIDNAPEGSTGQWDLSILTADYRMDELQEVGFDLLRYGLADPVAKEDVAKHWRGMPEFEQEDQSPHRSIVMHFVDQADVDRFARLIEQTITAGTKWLWYPYRERADLLAHET